MAAPEAQALPDAPAERETAGRVPVPPWHAVPATHALDWFHTPDSGLSDEDAARRLSAHGLNALAPPTPARFWDLVRPQITSLVSLLLTAAAAVAVATGDLIDAATIVGVLLLNAALGVITEWRARVAMDAVRSLEVPLATVVRAGRTRVIPARELVPGDLIVLEAGRATPADARLVSAAELQANEAALTGESLPVSKAVDAGVAVDAPLPDRTTMVYKATTIVSGTGRAVVVATGPHTQIGRIGTLTAQIVDEPTPLERRLDSLATRLAGVALVAGAVVAAIELVKHTPLGEILETGIAVAVAAVPEGLPAVVTITMALGLRRMARRHALVRRLPSVETLGAATVVCTDKTGTLTGGEQTVTSIWVMDRTIEVTGAGYAPLGTFREAQTPADPLRDPQLLAALRIAALTSRAQVVPEQHGWTAVGDPTDAALLVAARKAHLERGTLAAQYEEVGEVPFSSAHMLTASFHRDGTGALVALVKGAPVRVLDRCTHVLGVAGAHPLADAHRQRILNENAALAARGLRVIALARGTVGAGDVDALHHLTFVALAGLSDPPAAGAADAVRALRGAGIRTVMLTGDQRLTATALARNLGILTQDDQAIDGRDVDTMSDAHLASCAGRARVFSRLSPDAKLRIITALERNGEIVAMLGDGINDAPALRQSNIGVAMGRRGTDLAKDAAAVILTDDRFQTIVAAVEEGRTIYNNIRKFTFYLLSCNVGEILTLVGAGLAMLPLPLTALQILWLNLVTDTAPALALAVEPPDPDAMRRPPRDPKKTFLSPGLLRLTALYAALIAGAALGAFSLDTVIFHATPSHARTMTFTALALAQLYHLGNARSESAVRTMRQGIANRYAIAAVVLAIALQVAAVAYGPLSRLLELSPLTLRDWLIATGFALLPAVVGQSLKRRSQAARG
ncbi:MAG TPA: cation-translocating P-type ATPase [Gemmatimonadaceae bacterium]|nr:cation-translocating P-type ATPase [Gemmatimonadaceae bacterium]